MTCLRCVQLAACSLSLILATFGFALAQNGQQPGAGLTNQQIMSVAKFQARRFAWNVILSLPKIALRRRLWIS